MTFLRRAVAGLGATLAAALALVLPAAQAPAAGAAHDGDVRVLQLNLCGSGFAACWTGGAAPLAATVIREQAPDAVTLNEICAGDLPWLRRALAAGHHAGSVSAAFMPVRDRRTGAPVRCLNGWPYGIAVLGWTPAPGGHATTAGGSYRVQDPRQPEERAWVCLALPDRGGRAGLTACSTHLSSGSSRTAVAQCHELLGDVLRGSAIAPGGQPLVVGGDLNLAGPLPAGCRPAGFREAGSSVQHVLARGLAVHGIRTVDLQATTDHPGLLAVLQRDRRGPIRPAAGSEPPA